jgi:hypothetical protein
VSLLDAEHTPGGGLESGYKAVLSRKRLEGLVGVEAVAGLLSKFYAQICARLLFGGGAK